MRSNYISWDNYFMGVAILSAMRSKDPSTQVGAVIVNQEKRIVGIGYNGFPIGCHDSEFPWMNEGDYLETKYPYVVHAEPNAILNANSRTQNCTMYVTLFPCNECAKLIIQSGIKEIVYIDDKYDGTEANIASKKMLVATGVAFRKIAKITVRLES